MSKDSNENRPPCQGDLFPHHDAPPPVYGEPATRPYVAPFTAEPPADVIPTTVFPKMTESLTPSCWATSPDEDDKPLPNVEHINVTIPADVYNSLVKRIKALEQRTLVDEHIKLVRRVESIEAQVYGDDD